MLNFLKNRKNAVADLENRLNELNAEIAKLDKDKENAIVEINYLTDIVHQKKLDIANEISELEARRNNIDNEINSRLKAVKNIETGFGVLEEIGFERYTPTMYNNDIESKIFKYESKLAEMLGDDKVIIQSREYMIDGSASKGKRFQVNYGKNLLTAANNYIQSKEKSVTVDNYHKTVELISKKYAKFSADGNLLGISLSNDYFKIRLELLKLKLELKEKKNKERELLREEKRRMREQEKLLAEAEAEKKKLIELKKSMDIAYAKALTDKEREEIKKNINKLDKRIDDIDYRVNNPKSGWVYIIHSDCLPNMVKIGVSRRLNGPYERVKELSSSSLPTPYKLDGFCFSDDAFAVESNMHEHFDKVRVSTNREFFYTTPKEAIDVLKNEFNQKVIESEINDNE